MQENFTINDQNDRNFTHPDHEDETYSMQNVVLEENKEFKYTLFSMCQLWKKMRFNDSDRFSVRILFRLNQLTQIVHVFYLFLSTDMK